MIDKNEKISILDIKEKLQNIDSDILNSHPILKFRINQIVNNFDVRGIKDTDSHKCPLMLDDSVIAGIYHYKCVIHLREGGNPVGKVGQNMRTERFELFKKLDTHKDPICKKSCLDVCIQYNNSVRDTNFNLKKYYSETGD
jgi:hypothetical protein